MVVSTEAFESLPHTLHKHLRGICLSLVVGSKKQRERERAMSTDVFES